MCSLSLRVTCDPGACVRSECGVLEVRTGACAGGRLRPDWSHQSWAPGPAIHNLFISFQIWILASNAALRAAATRARERPLVARRAERRLPPLALVLLAALVEVVAAVAVVE